MTRYEITARHPVYGEILIGYSPRVSRSGLLAAMRKHGEDVMVALGVAESAEITYHTKPRVHAVIDGWTIGFSGRTQNEAKRDPHLFVVDVAKKLREHVCPVCDAQLGRVRLLKDTWGCVNCRETWFLPKRRAAA